MPRARSHVWIGLAALAVAALLWAALSALEAGAPRGGSHGATELASQRVDRPVVLELATNDGESELVSPEVASSRTSSTRRDERDEPGPALLVVDARSHAPIAGARVAWIDDALVRAVEPEVTIPSTAFARLAAQHGLQFTSDEHGRVALPRSRTQAYVEARFEDLAGGARVLPLRRDELVLELTRVQDVFVRVLDADGRPAAGVPLGCGVNWGLHEAPPARAETTADGLACFVDAPASRRAFDGNVELRVLLPFAEPVRATLDRPYVRDAPFEVRLPPTGGVHVRVDGAPDADPARVFVRRARANPSDGKTHPEVELELERGEARCERVGLGLELEVEVEATWGRSFTRLARVHGPERAGETVEAALSFADFPCVALRLLDARGDAVDRSTMIELLTDAPDGPASRMRRRFVPVDGRIEVLLPDPLRAGGRRFLRLSLDDERIAIVDLSRALPTGRTDLGDVRIGDGPIVAEGIVVDARGAPIAGANVRVEAFGGEPREWRRNDEPSMTTGADGRFRLLGFPIEEPRSVVARKSGLCPSTRRRITYGELGLELRLQDTGALAGRVLGATELARHGVELSAQLQEVVVERDPSTSRSVTSWKKEAFRLDALRPGRWRLELAIANSTVALRELDVIAGETTTAAPIDLRALVRTIAITCTDESGEPVRDANVEGLLRYRKATRVWRSGVRSPEIGKTEFLAGDEGFDVRITREGFESVFLTKVRTDQRVVLRRGVAVRVVAAGNEPLRDDRQWIGVRLTPHESARPISDDEPVSRAFVDGREFRVILPGEGAYRVEWFVIDDVEEEGRVVPDVLGGTTQSFFPNASEVVSVARTNGESVVVVTPPHGALARANDALNPSESRFDPADAPKFRNQRKLPPPADGPR